MSIDVDDVIQFIGYKVEMAERVYRRIYSGMLSSNNKITCKGIQILVGIYIQHII